MKLLLLAPLLAPVLGLPCHQVEPPPAAPPKVQVYIFLGQSNMLGYGQIAPQDNPGTLLNLVHEQGKYPWLLDEEGGWVERDDVHYAQTTVNHRHFPLTVKDRFVGVELPFGHVVGDATEAPVLLLKACIGNRSLGWDLLPPGSERFEHGGRIWAGYKDSPNSWEKGTEPEPINWYAGKQYDDDTANAKKVLAELEKHMPGYEGQGYEIAGFVWWQGHKDQNPALASRYEQNLVHLIKTLRKDFDAPEARFVLATIGFGGEALAGPGLQVAEAQLAVDGRMGKYPEFADNVRCIDARPWWREKDVSPNGRGYHYNHNAETYMEVGRELGEAMVSILPAKSGPR